MLSCTHTLDHLGCGACSSMITAFEAGGDFHSRTAYGMYDYIKEDIAAGAFLFVRQACDAAALSRNAAP